MLCDYLKEAVVNKYLLLWLVGCFGMTPMGNVLARELWYPIDAAELRTLPPYCTPRILENDKAGWKAGEARFGVSWNHLHHYCYALSHIGRYNKSFGDKKAQKFYLNGALGNFQYLFGHTTPDFWLRPEMHTQKGGILVSAKRGSEAVAEFMIAIQENKSYAPAYVALSNFYRDMGQKSKALSTVEEGLRYAPDNRSLASRYLELTGHAFVPPTVSAAPAEANITGVKTDANVPMQPAASIPTPASESVATPVTKQPAPAAEDVPKIGSPTNPYCRFCPSE